MCTIDQDYRAVANQRLRISNILERMKAVNDDIKLCRHLGNMPSFKCLPLNGRCRARRPFLGCQCSRIRSNGSSVG